MPGQWDNARRTGGSVDPLADHARQLPYLQKNLQDKIATVRTELEEAIATALLVQPPFGVVIKNIAAPGDNNFHAVAHDLGRPYVGGMAVGYYGSGAHVLIMAADYLATIPEDPATHFVYVNQYVPDPFGGSPLINAIHFDVWVW